MNRKTLTISIGTILLLLLSYTSACSEDKSYVSGHVGVSAPDNSATVFDSGARADFEFDDDFALAAAYGKRFGRNLRLELEFSHQENDFSRADTVAMGRTHKYGETESAVLLANIYYDFSNATSFTPFINAGLGYAKIDVSDIILPGTNLRLEGDHDYVPAYQFGAGIGYTIDEDFMVDLKYRYLKTSDPDFGSAETEFASHNYYLGLRFAF